MDWFLYDNGLRYERVNRVYSYTKSDISNVKTFEEFGLRLMAFAISNCIGDLIVFIYDPANIYLFH